MERDRQASVHAELPDVSNASGEVDVLILPDYTETNPYQSKLEHSLRARGLSVTTSSGGGRILPVLRSVIANGRPDIVHVNFLDQYMILSNQESWVDRLQLPLSFLLSLRFGFELLLLKLSGTQVVWTAHDKWNHERRALPVEYFFKHLYIRFLFDAVVVHCESAKRILVDAYRLPEYLTGKMVTIPHGHFIQDYPNDVTRAEARRRLDVDGDDVLFLFFGSIREYKNIPQLIRAFGSICDPRANLLVAGDPVSKDLRREVSTLCSDTERVSGELRYIPDEEVQVCMNAADVVVLPFRTSAESMLTSGSVVLAMGFGNPVIAPPIGCIGDLLDEDGGFSCQPDENGSLRSAMQDALEADRSAMGAYNRRKVRQFSWDHVAARTASVYNAIT